VGAEINLQLIAAEAPRGPHESEMSEETFMYISACDAGGGCRLNLEIT
jgi:hypothetical protein